MLALSSFTPSTFIISYVSGIMLCARRCNGEWTDKVPAFIGLIVQWGKQMTCGETDSIFRVMSARKEMQQGSGIKRMEWGGQGPGGRWRGEGTCFRSVITEASRRR